MKLWIMSVLETHIFTAWRTEVMAIAQKRWTVRNNFHDSPSYPSTFFHPAFYFGRQSYMVERKRVPLGIIAQISSAGLLQLGCYPPWKVNATVNQRLAHRSLCFWELENAPSYQEDIIVPWFWLVLPYSFCFLIPLPNFGK